MSVAYAWTFGGLLRHYRLRAGLTQEDLASRAGLSPRGISDLERGLRREPRPSTLTLLAEALGLSDGERARLFAAARGLIAFPPPPDGQQANAIASVVQPAPPGDQGSESLPNPPTPFVGRSGELAHLQRLLDAPESRLITLVGPGGMGKTRLAVETASRNRAAFARGVHFVALAGVASADALLFAIADVLGCSFDGPAAPVTQLATSLRDQAVLLVLDNMEHLLDGAPVLAELMAGAPHLKVLVTSRERLNLQGEWVLPIAGIDYPLTTADDDLEPSAAVRLFVQSARRVQPDFALQDNAPDILRICQVVEGMPLALELAATWVRLLPCSQIVEQLAKSLDFLASPLRDVPERHRSLRAVFDHSWKLLSPTEQTALAKLSVFIGAFDREAAEEVGGASLPVLASLADKSLLQSDGRGGFGLHELLRRYAADQLASQTDEAGHREQAITYVAGAAERASQAGAPRQAAGLLGQALAMAEAAGGSARLGELHYKRGQALSQAGMWAEARPELVAALAAARPDDADQTVQILLELSAVAFYLYDVPAMRHDVMEALAQAEAARRSDLAAAATVRLGFFEANEGFPSEAVRLYEQAIAQGGPQVGEAHQHLGRTLYWLSRYTEAVAHLRRAVELAHGDAAGQIFPLQDLGLALAATGQYSEAVQVFEQARDLSQAHENWPLLARSVANVAGFHLDVLDYEGHEALAQEARALARSADFVLAEVSAGIDLLFNFARRGEVERAATLQDEIAEAVEKARGSHGWLWRLRFTQARAELALARGEEQEALRLADSVAQQSREIGRVKYQTLALTTRAQALAALGRQSEATDDFRAALNATRPTGDPAMFFRVGASFLAIASDEALTQEVRTTAQRIRAALPDDEMRHIFDTAAAVRHIARLIG
ncbi:MAG TPA: helix-turn-helix domain-containing protein [Ktedonobacterales bacterium]|nr:helix-turn-helix domain-containing protein [Ktedonobacterales bacterium]